ncbi:MAG: hypothetical protein WB791_07645 [Waddliaceae bacterium]
MDAYENHPFYGEDVLRHQEQRAIEELLAKYKNEPVTEELQKKIWDDLQTEKSSGRIMIPFKVVMHRDVSRRFPDYIEIILDTKV